MSPFIFLLDHGTLEPAEAKMTKHAHLTLHDKQTTNLRCFDLYTISDTSFTMWNQNVISDIIILSTFKRIKKKLNRQVLKRPVFVCHMEFHCTCEFL